MSLFGVGACTLIEPCDRHSDEAHAGRSQRDELNGVYQTFIIVVYVYLVQVGQQPEAVSFRHDLLQQNEQHDLLNLRALSFNFAMICNSCRLSWIAARQ